MNFRYKISVIIPVYNSGSSVKIAFDSVKKQTMDFNDIEVLLVNDGSTDDSLEKCREIAAGYDNVKVLDKPNGGVSSARNFGLNHAAGKYIAFLDDDDTVSPASFEAIVSFFDDHYDELDLVAYSIDYVDENMAVTTHKRFNVLGHTGVYDINSDFNIIQTTMNVCVKNVDEGRILFDEKLSLGEDQWFIFSWILKKQKIGFVKEAVYTYYRSSGSASSVFNNPYYCFDQYMYFLNKLLDACRDADGKPHPTAQSLVVYNLGWRISSDSLVTHVDAQREAEQTAAIQNLLEQIEPRIICNSIYIDPYHVECFMRLKGIDCSYAVNTKSMSVYSENDLWFSQPHTLVFDTVKIVGDTCRIIGYVKNGVVDYKEFDLYYADAHNTLHKVEMQDTAYSYYRGKAKTNRFGGFDVLLDLNVCDYAVFKIQFGDLLITPTAYFGFKCAVNKSKNVAACGKYCLSFDVNSNGLSFKKGTSAELAKARSQADMAVKKESKSAFIYRKTAQKMKTDGEIWLYCDRENILDNAYEQFRHDFDKNDGVKRYYIVCDYKKDKKYFTPKQRKHLVKFKSLQHKLLFLNCSKILTSFNSVSIYSPFDGLPLKWYSDITEYETVYLQHGLLHARLPLLYCKEKSNIDTVVISSDFERNNFTNLYHFRDSDLIQTGMPRFDAIDISRKAKRKILFSPSWRKNLIGEYINNTRALYVDKFLKSAFYTSTMEFLNSKELADLLEKYDLTLDFKNHPIFRDYDRYMKVDNPRIRVTQDSCDMQDYLAMITDYSSIVFDFVYLERPILYFVPDYEIFKAGVTHSYNILDLPLEEGFGDIAQTADELLENIRYLAENDFVPKDIYAKRMQNFFGERTRDHAENLYQNLIHRK